MKIEYLIDKDNYKALLPKNDYAANNGLVVKKRNYMLSGKDNHLLKIYTPKNIGKPVEQAEALSEFNDKIKDVFLERKISFRILQNESAQFFAKQLFPLLCEFETKLRKLIQSAMFDISAPAEEEIVSRLKKYSIIDKKQDTLDGNFLEFSDLGKIIDFLFSNDELYKEIDTYKNKLETKYLSKEELIEYINRSDKPRIWDKYFSKEFGESILPSKIFEIKGYRNDVMHFHEISFQRYKIAEETIKLVNDDLEKQIKKGIVLEASDEIIQTIINNPNFYASILESIDKIFEQISSRQFWETYRKNTYAFISATNDGFLSVTDALNRLTGKKEGDENAEIGAKEESSEKADKNEDNKDD